MKKTKHYMKLTKRCLLVITLAIILGAAFNHGQSKYETYLLDHQEELRSSYSNGFRDGEMSGWSAKEHQYFNQIAEIADEIHG